MPTRQLLSRSPLHSKRTLLVVAFGLCSLAAAAQTSNVGTDAVVTGHDKETLDYVWVIVSAALVFLMQAGFMALESGLARAKNSINVAVKNLGDFSVAVFGFWIVGFGLMFGPSIGGWLGAGYSLFTNDLPWVTTFFVFQAVFVGTAATIVSGAIAERTRFGPYLVLSTLVSILIYPVFGHWAWGGLLFSGQRGWLEARGFIDFAGSTVVHSVGGWVALAAVILVGPRRDKFDERGRARKIQPHNLQLTYLGVFILFFGWFGFNAGSTLEATPAIGGIVFNTLLSAVSGALSGGAVGWLTGDHKAPEPEIIGNGLLGALVGITAGCATVTPAGAVAIGLVSGVLVIGSTYLLERRLKLDDVVGAIPVHGVCGVWGTIAVGIFAPRETLSDMGMSRLELVAVQSLGTAAAFAWAFGIGLVVVFIIKKTIGLRAPEEDESIGLNISEHGATSSLIDLANRLQSAQSVDRYDDSLKVEVEIGTEVGELSQLFNDLIDTLKDFSKTGEHAAQLKIANRQLAERQEREVTLRNQVEAERRRGNRSLAAIARGVKRELEGIHEQVERLVSFIGLMREFSAEWDRNLTGVLEVSEALRSSGGELVRHTGNAGDALDRSRDQFELTNRTVSSLSTYAEHIGSVSIDIDDISDKIRLLSINTAIEAARAGTMGGGFAVLAGEIRQLAEGSARSVKRIADTISTIRETATTLSVHVDELSRRNGELSTFQGTVTDAASREERATTVMAERVNELFSNSKRLSGEMSRVSEHVAPVFEAILQSQRRLDDIVAGCTSDDETVGGEAVDDEVEPAVGCLDS